MCKYEKRVGEKRLFFLTVFPDKIMLIKKQNLFNVNVPCIVVQHVHLAAMVSNISNSSFIT